MNFNAKDNLNNLTSNQQDIHVLHARKIWLKLTENWIHSQICNLPPEIQNTILCETRVNRGEFQVPNIYSLSDTSNFRYFWNKGLRRLGFRSYLEYFLSVSKELNADIIHSHFGMHAWENISIAKRNNLKHFVTFYGYDVNFIPRQNPKWYKRYEFLFGEVDKVLCEGSHMAECISRLGCSHEKIQVHHLGVDLEKIPFRPRNWMPRRPLKILIASSFNEKKGIPFAIEALARFQYKQDIQVTIIGDADSGELSQAEKEKILSLVEMRKMSSKVKFMGFQPHNVLIEEAYKNHVFLAPSITSSLGDTEGGAPVAIIEMIASGMPVVSTVHCDIPEVAFNKYRRLLSQERDIDGLVDDLWWLASHPKEWMDLLKEGRKHIEREYNSKTQGLRLAQAYHEALNLK